MLVFPLNVYTCLDSAHRDVQSFQTLQSHSTYRKIGILRASTQVYFLCKYLPPPDFAYLWHTWIYLSLPTIDHLIQKELFYLSLRLNNSLGVWKHTFPAFL